MQEDLQFDVEEHAAAMLTLSSAAAPSPRAMIFWERAWATHLPRENHWDLYGTKAGFSFVPHSEMLHVDMNPRLTRYGPRETIDLPVPPLAPPGPNVYQDFLEAVEGERAPACSGWEAAHMLRIIEAVYAAAESRVPA
jgi:predicted dehydrogenase